MHTSHLRRYRGLPQVTVAFAACLITGSTLAAANDADPSSWGIGAGGSVLKRPYRGIDDRTLGVPLISYESRWLSVSTPGIDLKALAAGPVSLRLRARYAFDGYKAKDSDFLAGMADRKSSAWSGVAALWRSDLVNVNAELLKDVSGHSEGTRASVVLDRRFPMGAFGLTPRVSGEWVDRKFVRYYYGVTAAEARNGRPLHEGDSTVNVLAGLRLDYSPAAHHTLFLDTAYTRLGSGITDSPLVDRSGQTSISVGYLYRF